MIFFTADTHYFHSKVIEYNSRPFTCLEHMHQILIDNWNNVVGKGDLVYHLGDFAFTKHKTEVAEVNKFISRLNGQIHLVLGNHDREAVKKANFAWIGDYKYITFEKQKIVLFHYPIASWRAIHHGSWHCFGHSHGSFPNHGLSLDVGVDVHNYTPLSFNEVKEIMSTKTPTFVDHHDTKTGRIDKKTIRGSNTTI